MTFDEALRIAYRRAQHGTCAHALAGIGVPLRLRGFIELETQLTAEAWFTVLESPYDRNQTNRGLLDDSH